MNTRFLSLILLVGTLLPAAPAWAQKDKLTLGVYLPTTMADGQKRFEFSQQLGAALEESLGRPVVVKNFGRYEDFAQASRNMLDVVVVDAWASAHLGAKDEPIALGMVGNETHPRWAVMTQQRGVVKDLAGKRLAVPRGVRSLDEKFVSNVIFGGDLNAKQHFKLVSVPNAESALSMLSSKSADAALLPLSHVPDNARTIFRSARLPGVVVIAMKADPAELRRAFEKLGPVGPVTSFTAPQSSDLVELRKLLVQGPPRRLPAISEAPILRPVPEAMVDVREVALVLPSFLDLMENYRDQPDD